MTSDAPLGEIVDFDPTEREPIRKPGEPLKKLAEATAVVIDPAPVANWRASSYDLLNGLEVTDQTDSIPGELFDRLFNR
jgi:hypothetical protein